MDIPSTLTILQNLWLILSSSYPRYTLRYPSADYYVRDVHFLKPFLREKFCSLESETKTGVNSILITILRFDQLPKKIELFAWWYLFRLVKRIIFFKLSKTDLPFRFCKKVAQKYFIYFWQKKWTYVCFVLLQICPILAYFFLIEALIELSKMLLRKKLFDLRFGNCSTPLQRCN